MNEEIKRKKNEWVVWEEAAKRWSACESVWKKGIREEVMSVEWKKKDYVGKS